MKVTLLTRNPDITLAWRAVRCCTTQDDITNDVSLAGANNALQTAIKAGHHSVLEHIQLTFAIEGISRTCSHQLVRHRLASYSQQSQRYADAQLFYYLPRSISHMEFEDYKEVTNFLQDSHDLYKKLVAKGIPKEDARYILPQCYCTQLIMSMNCRELLHFFELRLCNKAQHEIRDLAWKMFAECIRVLPEIFQHAGPECLTNNSKCKQPKPCGDSLSVSCAYKTIVNKMKEI